MTNVLVVGLGGFLGAILRFAISGWVNGHVRGFPLGTLVVNVLGCLGIGLLMGAVDAGRAIPDAWRFFLALGLLGAFTTFSTFGYEALELLRDERYGPAVLSVLANVVVGIAAVVAGRALAGQ
jgi:CrcB protein